jgi:hypothetical protein
LAAIKKRGLWGNVALAKCVGPTIGHREGSFDAFCFLCLKVGSVSSYSKPVHAEFGDCNNHSPAIIISRIFGRLYEMIQLVILDPPCCCFHQQLRFIVLVLKERVKR